MDKDRSKDTDRPTEKHSARDRERRDKKRQFDRDSHRRRQRHRDRNGNTEREKRISCFALRCHMESSLTDASTSHFLTGKKGEGDILFIAYQ